MKMARQIIIAILVLVGVLALLRECSELVGLRATALYIMET